MHVMFSWIAGGLAAAGAAWSIGKITLRLQADYLAIATLGIAEIILYVIKNEDWFVRGVKNVAGLSRPVPYEVNLQNSVWFQDMVSWVHSSSLELLPLADQTAQLTQYVRASSVVFVKLCYSALFLAVVLIILGLATRALNSPWGRMMRAIRDNETAAAAMGKDVTSRHRQVFIIGSAVIGISGAMLTTLDGQFTPGSSRL